MDGYSTVSTETYTTDATHNLVHATLAQGEKLSLAQKTVTTVVMKVSEATGIKRVHVSPDRCDDRVYTPVGSVWQVLSPRESILLTARQLSGKNRKQEANRGCTN